MIMQLAQESDHGPLPLILEKQEPEDYKDSHSVPPTSLVKFGSDTEEETGQYPLCYYRRGGGPSPPPSPPAPAPASPPPTMAPGHGASSPSAGLASLHHAIHNLHNLNNLQNFHNLQQSLQTQMAALAGLQGGLGVPGVGSLLHPHLAAAQQHPAAAAAAAATAATVAPPPPPSTATINNGPAVAANNAATVPQMVLTSGHVSQGVGSAQLLVPTSQGIAVQPILTILLGQANNITSSSLVNPMVPLHHLHQPGHHPQHPGSNNTSPLPGISSNNSSSPSSSSSTPAAPHPLLSLAGLPPSLFHPHHVHNNNNNNNINNNMVNEKPKLQLPLSSPITDGMVGLGARLGGHYPAHPPPPAARYSPDFLDNHNQPTISQSTGQLVDGVNLDEIKEFAKAFKIRRLSMGLTQTQVGQALSITEGPAYSQSAICRFEKLDITPKSAQKIKPVLERWMLAAEDRYKNGQHTLTEFMGNEPSKKRKRRTSFTPQALEILNSHFERITHPSGAEITALGEKLGYEREVVRIWFCNKRQALKNTVRMMGKPSPPGAPGAPGAPAPPPPTHPVIQP